MDDRITVGTIRIKQSHILRLVPWVFTVAIPAMLTAWAWKNNIATKDDVRQAINVHDHLTPEDAEIEKGASTRPPAHQSYDLRLKMYENRITELEQRISACEKVSIGTLRHIVHMLAAEKESNRRLKMYKAGEAVERFDRFLSRRKANGEPEHTPLEAFRLAIGSNPY